MIIKKRGATYITDGLPQRYYYLIISFSFLQRVVNMKRDKEGGTGCCVGSTWVFEILLLPLFFLIFALL